MFPICQAGRAGFDRGLDTGQELIGRSHLADFETLAADVSGNPQLGQCRSRERIVWDQDHRDSPNTGASSSKICSRLPLISAVWEVRPVIFAPGRFRLLTMPVPMGSPAFVKTMGMVVVAACAALAVNVPKPVTITSGFVATNSAAN